MNMSSGVKILVGAVVAVVAVVGVLAIPVHERCGGAGRVCATAPDDQGFIHYYYEVQPVLTVLVDQFTGHKPLVYSSGVELVPVNG
ncbi:MAG: hypothetical protein U0R77_08500 [Mycolicibacterium insubricum]|nr:hypothetical protein [Mycobacterium sp.]